MHTLSQTFVGILAVCGSVLVCGTSGPADAQTYRQVGVFDGTDGRYPVAPLVQGADGNFYGTTKVGGAYGEYGTVFKVTRKGRITVLHSFCAKGGYCPDGSLPMAGLALGPDGNFYGTTSSGGDPKGRGGFPSGTIFEITPKGAFTTLYSFCNDGKCKDGAVPEAGVVLGSDGNFYGTTTLGGTHKGNVNAGGTIFAITPQGTLTTIYNFCTRYDCTDGYDPMAALLESANGSFYGTTRAGGTGGADGSCNPSIGCGTIFELGASGRLKTLYNFCSLTNCSDGSEPQSALVQSNGAFYGTTPDGGTDVSGTIFSITAKGKLTTLVGSGLFYPNGLIVGSDGNLYGTEVNGGAENSGAVFQMTPGGAVTLEYSFCNCDSDGGAPVAPLFLSADGTFYGTTTTGAGTSSNGTVFSLTAGMPHAPSW